MTAPREPTGEKTGTCRFYEEIGAGVCDRCGYPAREHDGYRLLRKGASPFGSGGGDWEDVTWAEWKIRLAESERVRQARQQFAALSDGQIVALSDALAAVSPSSAGQDEA